MFTGKTVLIVCHTAYGQMDLSILMKRLWYKPILAKTAEEAVVLAGENRFELIILDGDLPGQALQKSISLLRRDPAVKDFPLVLFTAEENTEKKERLISSGCAAIIAKPVDVALAFRVLGRLCKEPRNDPRISVKFRVTIEEGAPEDELTCINLSEGGMYLRTPIPLPEGTILHIRYSLPHDVTTIKLEAVVVRTARLEGRIEFEPGMGLRFNDMPEDARQVIRNFVQWEMAGDLSWEPEI